MSRRGKKRRSRLFIKFIFYFLDFTMTHDRYGSSKVHITRNLTHIRSSDGAPNPDGALKNLYAHWEASALTGELPEESDP